MLKPTPSKPGLFSVACKQFRALQGIAVVVFGTLGLALAITATFVMTTTPSRAYATPPNTLNFQARLESANGAIVPDGNYGIEFKLYDASSSSGSSQGSCTGDAHCLWTETRTGANQVHVANGYMTVDLGSVNPFPAGISWDQQLYVTMNIFNPNTSSWDGEMNPRLSLTGVPYAFQSKSAESLTELQGSATDTLQFATDTTNSNTITLPDLNGSFGLMALQTSTNVQQTGGFNVSGTGLVGTLDATGSGTANTLVIGATATSTGIITIGGNATTGSVTIGGINETGTITVGRSTGTNTINIGNANTATGNTQTINIGAGTDAGTGKAIVTVGNVANASQTTVQAGTGGLWLQTGRVSSGTSGNVVIQSGDSSSGTAGNITIDAGVGTVSTGSTLESDGFETGTDGWTAWFNSSVAQSSTYAHTGTHSFAITDTAAGGGNWGAQNYTTANTVTPGQVYAFTAWIRSTVAEQVTLQANWNGGAGATDNVSTVTDTTTGWTEMRGIVTAPAGATSVWPTLATNGSYANGTITYLDDVTIIGGASAPIVSIGATNAASITVGNTSEAGSTIIQGGSSVTNTISNNGDVVQSISNSTTAFQIQDAGGNSAFQVNTTTQSVQVASDIDTIGNSNLAIGDANATGVSIGNTGVNNLTTIYGSTLIKSAAGLNSTTAFQVQNADGSNTVLNVDTTNSHFTVNGYTAINQGGVPLALNSTGSTPEAGILLQVSGTTQGEIGVAGSTGHILGQATANDLAIKSLNGSIYLGANSSSNASVKIANGGAALFQNNTNSTTAFQVQTSGSFGTGSPVLDVDTSNSRVGINTLSPGADLNVRDSRTAGNTPYEVLRVETNNAGAGAGGWIQFADSATTDMAHILGYDTNNYGGGLVFFTKTADGNGGTAASERMRIDASGSVGIGTTSPSSRLDVAANNTSTVASTLLLEQAGTGDTSLQLKASNSDSYYIGADSSDSNRFKISSSTTAGGTSTVGNTATSGTTDSGDNASYSCSLFTASASGTISSVTVTYKNIDATNKLAQAAVYSNSSGNVGSLLGSSSSVTLSSAGQQTFDLTSGVSVVNGTSYWLCSDSNTASASTNNLVYNAGTTGQEKDTTTGFTFGSWPSSMPAATFTAANQFEIYATINLSTTDEFSGSLFSLTQSGQAVFQNSANSTSAFQVQNASGGATFDVDTSNSRVGIGTTSPNAQLEVGGSTYLGTQVLTANDQADVCLFGNSSCGAAQSGAFNDQLNIFGGSSQTRHLLLYQAASGNAFIGSSFADLVIETTSNNANIWLEPNGTGKVISDTIYAINPSTGNSAEGWHNFTIPSGWSDNSGNGTGFRYRLEPDGTVLLSVNMIAASSVSNGSTIIATFPTGYIPATGQNIALTSSNQQGSGSQSPHFFINSSGQIKYYGINGGAVLSANGIIVLDN